MNEKLQQLLFDKGITNIPSDALCSDNAIAYEEGLIYREGEHRVIQQPVKKFKSTHKLLFVHNMENGAKYYIFDSGTQLYYGNTVDSSGFITTTAITGASHTSAISSEHIKAVGKTIIVSYDDSLHYILFKNNAYQYIGTTIPRPIMEFAFLDNGEQGTKVQIPVIEPQEGYVETAFRYLHVGLTEGVPDGTDEEKEVFDNSVKGLYAKGKKMGTERCAFTLPFMIRYALKLYDGSYTHISNPIPMFPNATNSCFIFDMESSGHSDFFVHAMRLYYKNFVSYNGLEDIVKKISIFVSRGIELYDLTVPFDIQTQGTGGVNMPVKFINAGGKRETVDAFYPFVRRTAGELEEELESTSVFYHLCDIEPTSFNNGWLSLANHFQHTTLDNITTQEQLPYDNFYSLAPLGADYLYTYNNRLNLARVKRGFFEGFDNFSGLYVPEYDESQQLPQYVYAANIYVYVRIASDSGDRVVCHVIQRTQYTTKEAPWNYFFYPDTRANHVTMISGGATTPAGTLVLDADLKEHEGLNGAYYLRKWPDVTDYYLKSEDSASQTLGPSSINITPEELFSYIITSEVNNPYVFLAEGYNRVGTGYVIGMATQTAALSEGQFGQFPLIVFTTEGLWAMALNDTGLYTSVKPFSREVAIKDNPAITETDGAVFFVSKKGLMVIRGSQVMCVSQQLAGKTDAWADPSSQPPSFLQILETCKIAYDYRDKLLWIFYVGTNQDIDHIPIIYSISNGTFARCSAFALIDGGGIVNDYPDTIVQDKDATINNPVYSFIDRPDINADTDEYDTSITTRPMKLENALALKSILQVRHILQLSSSASLTFKVYASNNLETWVQLTSLRGTPWKYYRFKYVFSSLKAVDTFSGTVLVTQERRTDKLR